MNKDDFTQIGDMPPFASIIENDAEFKQAIDDSKVYFDLSTPLESEGTDVVRQLAEKGDFPIWAPGIAEGGDFWSDVMVDDYAHPVQCAKATVQFRRVFYAILGRSEVVEHQAVGDQIVAQTVAKEPGFPKYKKLRNMKSKHEKNLRVTFLNLVHCNFAKCPPPNDPPLNDPINKFIDPMLTIALVLRFVVSICFTDNQAPHTRLPGDAAQALKDVGVVGAPPIDLFELKALAIMAIVLIGEEMKDFEPPSVRPRLRHLKVTALYQSVLQHILWLQQLCFIKNDLNVPHRLFDGELFAAAYDAGGDPRNDAFAPWFKDPEAVARVVEERLPTLLTAVLAPFPPGLFEAFASAPRSLAMTDVVESKSAVVEVKVAKSAFAGLLDSDSYSDDGGAAPAPPPQPPQVAVAPPRPGPKKQPKKKKEDDEDDEAFLLKLAQKNAQASPPTAAAAAPPPAKRPAAAAAGKKKPHVRKAEGGPDGTRQTFGRESKQELKRQLKQQVFDYN
jgi:hypothetical protein